MLKAVQVVQRLPYNQENPFLGREIILQDDSGMKVELAFTEEDQLTVMFGRQMFDIYGREVEVGPEITKILGRAGRRSWCNTDAETYLVEKDDGKIYLAYVNYYYCRTNGTHETCILFLYEMSPLFKSGVRVELECTNLEIIDQNPFPENSAILRYGKWLGVRPWVAKRNGHYFLLSPEDTYAIPHSVFKRKTDARPAYSSGNYFIDFSYEKGKITAKVLTGTGEELMIGTDDEFIESILQRDIDHTELPFYLLDESP